MKRLAKDIPQKVKDMAKEHKEEGKDDGYAFALAWSRYCEHVNPDSPHCKKDDYFHGEGKSSSHQEMACRIANDKADKLVEEYVKVLADQGRKITLEFVSKDNGRTAVKIVDSEIGEMEIGDTPASFAIFARTIDYWAAPEGDVTDIERNITEMEGKEYKEAAKRAVQSSYKRYRNPK